MAVILRLGFTIIDGNPSGWRSLVLQPPWLAFGSFSLDVACWQPPWLAQLQLADILAGTGLFSLDLACWQPLWLAQVGLAAILAGTQSSWSGALTEDTVSHLGGLFDN